LSSKIFISYVLYNITIRSIKGKIRTLRKSYCINYYNAQYNNYNKNFGEYMDNKELVIILSDIHMGTNAPTVWYRKEIHEKYLSSILDEIIANANQIQELILLGDIFDFWSYPPDVIPPSIDDIILCHPNILGPDGKLNQALTALEGRVVYIPGDHDMCITVNDLKKIKNPDGYSIKYHVGIYIPTYDTTVLFTHGHEYTILNAPFYYGITEPLPIGYFISRAIAYKIDRDLYHKPNLTVSDLESHGLSSVKEYLFHNPDLFQNNENASECMHRFLNAIEYITGMPRGLYININNSVAISLNDLKPIYKDLFYGLSKVATESGVLFNDYDGSYLPWFAQKYGRETYTKTVVMGHSHIPITTNGNDQIQYLNTGCMCPPLPDMSRNPITYGVYNKVTHSIYGMKCSNTIPLSFQLKDSPIAKLLSKESGNYYSAAQTNLENITPSNDTTTPNQNTTQPSTPQKYLFGWSVYNASWEYYLAMQLGVLSKAKELGIEVLTHDQKSNTIEMITGCFNLLSKGINVLIISPYNPEGVPIIVAYANKLNIPVVVIDGGTGGADVVAFIVSDSFGGGILAGEYALKLIREHSIRSRNTAIIKAEPTATYALRRGEGFKRVMLDSNYKVIAEISANGEQVPAYNIMKNILYTYENDLAVVFCENGLMTLGAAQAIEEAGKKGEIMLIGFDADPSVIAGIKEGKIQGTIAQQPFKMGEIGVDIGYTVLNNGQITFDDWTTKEIYMEVYLIDETGAEKMNII
jgi:ribose transport system substrate-binding protein